MFSTREEPRHPEATELEAGESKSVQFAAPFMLGSDEQQAGRTLHTVLSDQQEHFMRTQKGGSLLS
eukprot:2100363-Amphidinium_carterae.1